MGRKVFRLNLFKLFQTNSCWKWTALCEFWHYCGVRFRRSATVALGVSGLFWISCTWNSVMEVAPWDSDLARSQWQNGWSQRGLFCKLDNLINLSSTRWFPDFKSSSTHCVYSRLYNGYVDLNLTFQWNLELLKPIMVCKVTTTNIKRKDCWWVG